MITSISVQGLIQSGAWMCFDEVNRIHTEVISVMAHQIQTIQRSIHKRATRIQFEDTSLRIDPTCSVFITLNPR